MINRSSAYAQPHRRGFRILLALIASSMLHNHNHHACDAFVVKGGSLFHTSSLQANQWPTTTLGMTTSASSSQPPPLSRPLIIQGMERFRNADIQGSIASFDAAIPAGYENRATYLWQRGISYYYADDFEAGSRQFREDVLSSPLDVEEIVWDIACLARMPGTPFPPPTMLSLPPGKKDRRPIMSVVYDLFRGDATEESLAMAGHDAKRGSDEFYALLYLSLYNEIRGNTGKAENYMKSAVRTQYAKVVGSRDYMVDVAKVHCQLRHWDMAA